MGRVLLVPGGLGSHMGAAAVRDAAARGLLRSGWDVLGAPLTLGEPGTVEALVRQVGGRVHSVAARGGEPIRYGALADGTAILDRTAIREHGTQSLAVVLRRVWDKKPRRVLLALGGVRQTDFGRGLYEGLGVEPANGLARWPLPSPVTHLVVEPSTVPVAGLRAREWVTRLEEWRGRAVGHYSGELGPALAALGVDARPAAAYLVHYLKLSTATETADWILTVVPTVGPTVYGGIGAWAAETARRSRRPTWMLVGQLLRGYQELHRTGPVGLYPLLDQIQTQRQLERRAVTLVEQAAYRLGVGMQATLAPAPRGRHRERSREHDGHEPESLRDGGMDGEPGHPGGGPDVK